MFYYNPKGVCSQQIVFSVDSERKIRGARFIGGCQGNTQGVCSLIEGMDIDEVIKRLEGIQCGFKGTSCPDQLAKALIAYKETNQL